jgi:hypothetical protein
MATVAQGGELHSFNIPAGDLAHALESLAKETGLELIFQPKELRGIVTQGVQGTLSPQEAVARLLQGTNLTIRTEQGGAMLISAAPPVATGASGAALLSPRARRETERLRLAQATFVQDTTPASPAERTAPPAAGNRIEEVIVTAQ